MEFDEEKIDAFATERAWVHGADALTELPKLFSKYKVIFKITLGASVLVWIVSLVVLAVGTSTEGLGAGFVAGFVVWIASLVLLTLSGVILWFFAMSVQRMATGKGVLWVKDVLSFITGFSPDGRLMDLISKFLVSSAIKDHKEQAKIDRS